MNMSRVHPTDWVTFTMHFRGTIRAPMPRSTCVFFIEKVQTALPWESTLAGAVLNVEVGSPTPKVSISAVKWAFWRVWANFQLGLRTWAVGCFLRCSTHITHFTCVRSSCSTKRKTCSNSLFLGLAKLPQVPAISMFLRHSHFFLSSINASMTGNYKAVCYWKQINS